MRTHPVFNDIQVLHHEKPTLEAREVTKLLRRDTTPSNDEFSSYVRSIKLIITRNPYHLVEKETLDLYCEGATLSKFIYNEVRPTITKRLSLLFDLSDEPIRRLYGIPSDQNYIDDHRRQDRQEASISSQLVEYFPRYKHQSVA